MPMVLGHEAAGVVEHADPATGLRAPGDHVVFSFVPELRHLPALCRRPARRSANRGRRPTPRACCWAARVVGATVPEGPVSHHLGVSGFAEHIVVSARSAVRIDAALPLDIAALFGCAVMTGVGAVVNTARVPPGASVAVFGLGGVGPGLRAWAQWHRAPTRSWWWTLRPTKRALADRDSAPPSGFRARRHRRRRRTARRRPRAARRFRVRIGGERGGAGPGLCGNAPRRHHGRHRPAAPHKNVCGAGGQPGRRGTHRARQLHGVGRTQRRDLPRFVATATGPAACRWRGC